MTSVSASQPSSTLHAAFLGTDNADGDAKFSKQYHRNHKRNKIKNIGCFPTCGNQAGDVLHQPCSFCGRPVTFCFTIGDVAEGDGLPGRRLELEPQEVSADGKRWLSTDNHTLSPIESVHAALSKSPTFSEVICQTTWEREHGTDLEAFRRMTCNLAKTKNTRNPVGMGEVSVPSRGSASLQSSEFRRALVKGFIFDRLRNLNHRPRYTDIITNFSHTINTTWRTQSVTLKAQSGWRGLLELQQRSPTRKKQRQRQMRQSSS